MNASTAAPIDWLSETCGPDVALLQLSVKARSLSSPTELRKPPFAPSLSPVTPLPAVGSPLHRSALPSPSPLSSPCSMWTTSSTLRAGQTSVGSAASSSQSLRPTGLSRSPGVSAVDSVWISVQLLDDLLGKVVSEQCLIPNFRGAVIQSAFSFQQVFRCSRLSHTRIRAERHECTL